MKKKLSIVVERGTSQVGGCCTRINYGDSCIIIDVGSELPGSVEKELYVSELMNDSSTHCNGLLLTHYHGDHVGEIDKISTNIKVFASSTTKEVMNAYQEHMGIHSTFHIDMDRIVSVECGVAFQLGEFTITAIESDHSAIGSVMYLVEVGGQRILHTGDFRMHGNRRSRLLNNIRDIGKIDLLITEGTTLSRKRDKECWDEERVRCELKKLYGKYKYVFVMTSSTNLDRLQIVSEEVKLGKYFVVNKFQKRLMNLSEELGECIFNKPLYYSDALIEGMENMGFVMIVNTNHKSEELMNYFFNKYPQESCLIYSMWSGYLEYENIKKISDIAGNKMFFVHSSGHVTIDDLNTFIDVVNPKKIIVIHTECFEKKVLDAKDRVLDAKDGVEIYL